jgi:hypothetical protein
MNRFYTSLTILACTCVQSVFAQDLTLSSGASLTVNSGSFMQLGGNLSNAGTITLNASTTEYSQLKLSGTASGAGTVVQKQYLEAGSHTISSPVSTGFTTTSGDNTQLYSYDANVGNWAAIGSNISTAGLGFAARVDATQIPFLTAAASVSVTGTPNTSMTHNLGYFGSNSLAGGSGTGWNLIGNPYTCSLDWSTVSLTNVTSAFYIWDEATSAYKYYSAGGISSPLIPPMQGFWVQATSSGASISTTMASNGTVTTPQTYFKTLPDNLVVKVSQLSDTTVQDRLWVSNILGAQDGFDGAFDAWKMTNGASMPNVYTYVDAEEIAINAVEIQGSKILPMGFDFSTPGSKFRVHLDQITQGQTYQVYLEDKLTQSFHDLTTQDVTFTHGGWSQEAPRFALHFSLNTVGEDEIPGQHFIVYQDHHLIIMNCPDCAFTEYRLYAMNGQEIFGGQITSEMLSVEAPQKGGLYILELVGPHSSVREKIVIQY